MNSELDNFSDYSFDDKGRPLNPLGRTGISGRGILGRFGPNHAADPIVSRIKDGRLQFVAIKRKDTGESFLSLEFCVNSRKQIQVNGRFREVWLIRESKCLSLLRGNSEKKL